MFHIVAPQNKVFQELFVYFCLVFLPAKKNKINLIAIVLRDLSLLSHCYCRQSKHENSKSKGTANKTINFLLPLSIHKVKVSN